MGRVLRRVALALGVLGTVIVTIGLIWLSRSTVVLTAGGVYDSIMLPVGSRAIRWRADQSTIATAPNLQAMHGPVVIRLDSVRHRVMWYCRDRVHQETVAADSVTITCLDQSTRWQWRGPSVATATTLLPVERLAVVSDLEGDTAYFGAWARALGVTDSLGHWAYGSGQIVVLGDITDRGRWVYPLLWTLHRLEAEAAAQRGAVHVVLGNHEQYDLTGVTKDIEAEHHFAMRQLGTYHGLLDTTSVLGQWLRTRPVALRIGRTLFVHGGVSPAIVAQNVSIDSLNVRSRDFLLGRTGAGRSRDEQLGQSSVTQYRGLLMATEEEPLADSTHVTNVLRQYDVDRIVVGHTEVDSIAMLHGARVIGVNASLGSAQALVLEKDVPRAIPIGVQRAPWAEPGARYRRFALFARDDWRALLGVFSRVVPQ